MSAQRADCPCDGGLGPCSCAESTYYEVPKGDFPHDVAVGPSGAVWYAGQNLGIAGRLNPANGQIERIPLGKNSAPHGVIIGPDGAPWFTDGGQNAIVRVDPVTKQVKTWGLPSERRNANLNTAAFDSSGRIWFTGQNGIFGRLDPTSGDMNIWELAQRTRPIRHYWHAQGRHLVRVTGTNYLANVNLETGATTVYEPPTRNQGARRVWSDSKGRLWISEWNSGNVSVYDPMDKTWKQWKLPGEKPRTYGV